MLGSGVNCSEVIDQIEEAPCLPRYNRVSSGRTTAPWVKDSTCTGQLLLTPPMECLQYKQPRVGLRRPAINARGHQIFAREPL